MSAVLPRVQEEGQEYGLKCLIYYPCTLSSNSQEEEHNQLHLTTLSELTGWVEKGVCALRVCLGTRETTDSDEEGNARVTSQRNKP